MRVAVSGSGGLVGAVVAASLADAGDEVVRLVRRVPAEARREVRWDPESGIVDASGLEGISAVIHLAGENIAAGRWNARRKAAIRESRVEGTRILCGALAGLSRPPDTLVCASAIGFYGDRGDELLTEGSVAGKGFLADVCRDWEAATAPAARKGIRVVALRIGVVLSQKGGALSR
ncbi:MAG TPA: NAD-dependent epimerase/dehydratase family protein, partial [Candidatus Deferrimicrobiaceae bacterium]